MERRTRRRPDRSAAGPGAVAGLSPASPSLSRRRWSAPWPSAAPELLSLVASLTILVPAALLSAVTPMVTKLLLTSLDETGTVVGRLSGIGTVGAIVGTVVTGFVLISRVPVSGILVGLGAALVAGSALLGWRLGRRAPSPARCSASSPAAWR